MSAAAFVGVLALIGLACCAAVYCAERDVERQDRERVAEVTRPTLRSVPDRGWHASNNEGGHHPEARETADGRYRPGCTCPWDCLRLDPRSDTPWPTAGEAIAEAHQMLHERGSR